METYGLSGQDLVKHFNSELSKMENDEISDSVRFQALAMLSDIDYRIAVGCNPQIQFDAFLANIIAISHS